MGPQQTSVRHSVRNKGVYNAMPMTCLGESWSLPLDFGLPGAMQEYRARWNPRRSPESSICHYLSDTLPSFLPQANANLSPSSEALSQCLQQYPCLSRPHVGNVIPKEEQRWGKVHKVMGKGWREPHTPKKNSIWNLPGQDLDVGNATCSTYLMRRWAPV